MSFTPRALAELAFTSTLAVVASFASAEASVVEHGAADHFAVSDDHRRVIVVAEGAARLADAATAGTLATVGLTGRGEVRDAKWLADSRAAVVTDRGVTLVEIDREPVEVNYPDGFGPPERVAGEPTGKRLLLATDKEALVLEVETGEVVGRLDYPGGAGETLLGPGGGAAVVLLETGLAYWDAAQGAGVVEGDAVRGSALADDHRRAAFLTTEGVLLWRLGPLETTDGVKDGDLTAAWLSPAGDRLITANSAGQVGVSAVSPEGKLRLLTTLEDLEAKLLAWSADGERIAYVTDDNWKRLRIVSLGGGQPVELPVYWVQGTPTPVRIALDEDGSHVVTQMPGGRLVFWDVEAGGVVHEMDTLDDWWLHPSGDSVLVKQADGRLVTHQVGGAFLKRRQLRLPPLSDPRRTVAYHSLQFSPDGRRLAIVTGDYNRCVVVYDLPTGRARFAKGRYHTCQWTADGGKLYLLGGAGAGVYDAASGSLREVTNWNLGGVATGERTVPGVLNLGGKRRQVVFEPKTGLAACEVDFRYVGDRGLWATSLDGRRLGRVGRLRSGGGRGVEVVDIPSGQPVGAMPFDSDSFVGVAFDPAGADLLVATCFGVERLDYAKGQQTNLLSIRPPETAAPSDSGSSNSGGRPGFGLKLSKARAIGNAPEVAADLLVAMDVAPSGWLATAHRSGAVRVWDPRRGEVTLTLRNPPVEQELVALAPDGSYLACAPTKGREVQLVDLRERLPNRGPDSEAPEPGKPRLRLGF